MPEFSGQIMKKNWTACNPAITGNNLRTHKKTTELEVTKTLLLWKQTKLINTFNNNNAMFALLEHMTLSLIHAVVYHLYRYNETASTSMEHCHCMLASGHNCARTQQNIGVSYS